MIRYIERTRPADLAVCVGLTAAGCDPLIARLMAARGVETLAQAEAFLNPSLDMLNDPFKLSGMERAAQLLRDAERSGKRVLIYGDYDVDGVCACSILREALERHGAHVSHYVPSRHEEGYGLTVRALEKLRGQCDIMVTVDCGITSAAEACWAAEHGLPLIITDHHEPPEELPECAAVVDPLIDDPKGVSPCGAGVAFKLVQAMYGLAEAALSLDLAALATIADLVPLLGENRIIAAAGLKAMRSSERPGLLALINAAKLSQRTLSAGQVGFQIAPRINAGGRIAHADRNIELLLSRDKRQAAELADELNRENERRQTMQRGVFEEAERSVLAECDFLRERVMMPVGDGWNHGVIGLAASSLVEKYRIPAIVFTRDCGDGTQAPVCVGSARSVPGVHIQRAMSVCGDLFTRFGGHAQAAGCTLPADRLPELRTRLNAALTEQADPDAFIPAERYDEEIELTSVNLSLIDKLKALEPHGIGNPAPTFRMRGARVLSSKACGADQSNLKMLLGQGSFSIDAIAFGQAKRFAAMPQTIDVLAHCSANEWQGRRTAQCQAVSVAPDSPSEAFMTRCEKEGERFGDELVRALMAITKPTALTGIAADGMTAMPRDRLRTEITGWLRRSHQGTLIACSSQQSAMDMAAWLKNTGLDKRVDFMFGMPDDPRSFNTLAALPDFTAGHTRYDRVILIDGIISAASVDSLKAACPGVELWYDEDACAKYARSMAASLPNDEQLRGMYRTMRRSAVWRSITDIAAACGAARTETLASLEVFHELGFIELRREPFEATVKPSPKRGLEDSLLYRHARGMETRAGQAGTACRQPEEVSV